MQPLTEDETDRQLLDSIVAAIEDMNWAHETPPGAMRRVNTILHHHEDGYRDETQWTRIATAAYQRAEEKAEEDTLDHEQRPWFVCFAPHQCATLPEARERAGDIARTTGQPERVLIFRDIVEWTTRP